MGATIGEYPKSHPVFFRDMAKEPIIEQPSLEAQMLYQSIVSNNADEVEILRTRKKYKIRWLKNGQLVKLGRLLLHNKSEIGDKTTGNVALDEIIEDSKLACKAAAIYTLDGYWKIKFRYWFRWRWFYYVRQYDNIQLADLLETGKKKVPLMQFYKTITSLTAAKDTLMNMRVEEVEATLQGLDTARRTQTESSGSGS